MFTAALLAAMLSEPASALELPNRLQTPGAIVTTDAAMVCAPGYARNARKVTPALRNAAFNAYGIPRGRPAYRGGFPSRRRLYALDHLVPLELGGANNVRNLWPQPRSEAKDKDRIEKALHAAVCSGQLPLIDAQQRIERDWVHALTPP